MSKREINLRRFRFVTLLLPLMMVAQAGPANTQGKNGTTLAAYKTLDICEVTPTTWRSSGYIAVWNEGVIDTKGLAINDRIQYKSGTDWVLGLNVPIAIYSEIPAGTTMDTATIFPYTVDGGSLPGPVRNVAGVTITNHQSLRLDGTKAT